MGHKLKKDQIINLECEQVVATRAKTTFKWGHILILILIVLILDGFLLEELIDRNLVLHDALVLWAYIQIPLALTMILVIGHFYRKVLWNNNNIGIHPIVLVKDDCILVRNNNRGMLYKLEKITDIAFVESGEIDKSDKAKKSSGKVTFEYENKKICIGNIYDPQRATRVLQDLIEKLKINNNINRPIY